MTNTRDNTSIFCGGVRSAVNSIHSICLFHDKTHFTFPHQKKKRFLKTTTYTMSDFITPTTASSPPGGSSGSSDDRLLCRFDLQQSQSDKFPPMLQYVLDRDGGVKGSDLISTISSLRDENKGRQTLAAVPCAIVYTILFFSMILGVVGSIALMFLISALPLLFLLVPVAFLAGLLVVMLLYTTVMPLIFVNPLQKLAFRRLRKTVIPKLNESELYANSHLEFRLLTCVRSPHNKRIKREEKRRFEEKNPDKVESEASNDDDGCGSNFLCDDDLHLEDLCHPFVCVILLVFILFVPFVCAFRGISLLDICLNRDGLPAGVWIEVWLKPSSDIVLPSEETVPSFERTGPYELASFSDGNHANHPAVDGYVPRQATSSYEPAEDKQPMPNMTTHHWQQSSLDSYYTNVHQSQFTDPSASTMLNQL